MHYLVDRQHQRNSVDRAFLAAVVPKRLTIQTQETSEKWTRAFDTAVLLLGDTQAVTSVAILLSGFVQLPCGISTYHWQTLVNLGWFSALTHLTALTSLRHFFRRRPAMALWRIVFMGLTLVLLASAFSHGICSTKAFCWQRILPNSYSDRTSTLHSKSCSMPLQ